MAGSVVDAAPTKVRLTFSEDAEPSLSTLRVVDVDGVAYEIGPPRRVAGDPKSLEVQLRPLDRRVYTVRWRSVSAVDGHPTAGAFAFGVGVLPTIAAVDGQQSSGPSFSWLELAGRGALLAGLATLLGGSFAGAVGFGRLSGGRLAAVAMAIAAVGLVVLGEAQRRNADASFSDLWPTSVGRALAWRAAGLAFAAAALLIAHVARGGLRRAAMAIAATAAAATMAVHVDAGHAAGKPDLRGVVVALQWAHFAAAGVWLGGLIALLVNLRGPASPTKAAAVRRYSSVAVVAFAGLVMTGIVRALGEVATRHELTSTGYGRAVLVKSALVTIIAGLAALNRWRNVRIASTDLRPLRRTGAGEILLATAALVAAASLAGLSPPAAARDIAPPGLDVSGHDFATSVKVRLTTTSALPGPNRFAVRAVDFDSGRLVRADAATLRFTPLDDPDVAPTTLALRREPDGSYVALGNNLSLDGRWEVAVLLERGAASVVVPLTLETRRPPQFVSVTRVPGEAPIYSVQIADETDVGFTIDPERPGRSSVSVAFFDIITDARPIDRLVLTVASGDGPARQQRVRRVSENAFVADIDLEPGRTRIAAIARTDDGARLWATFELVVPS
jgi:copper transport protein